MPQSLSEDEFRLLAYVRAYADNLDQHLDPHWVQSQLSFSTEQMFAAARGLAARGLAEINEFDPPEVLLREHPEILGGVRLTDICLTERGWDLLREDRA